MSFRRQFVSFIAYGVRAALFFAIMFFAIPGAYGQEIKVEIITEIRPISVFTFQAGEKSRQVIVVDFSKKTLSASFTTGHTTILGFDLNSIRDDFKVSGQSFSGNTAAFTAKGQTASAVGVLPDIDYEFVLRVNAQQRKVWISGCHNEYPSYRIFVGGKKLYDREQTGTPVDGLIGNCDEMVLIDGATI